MTISRLIAACGMCVAFGTATAQTEQPARQPTTPPSSTPTSPATPSTPTTTSSASLDDTRALLKKLEGNWKVDVTVNTALWNPHLFKDVNDKNPSNINDAPRDRSTTTRDGSRTDANDRNNPANNRDGDRTNMDKDRLATGEGMKTFTGYTRNELILGDVLQQTTYMPDLDARAGSMGKNMDGKDPSRTGADDRNADGTPRNKDGEKYNDKSVTRNEDRTDKYMKGDGKFKGVSLLSFDQGSKTYSMVFLSNGEDQMHLKNGTYTTTGNQIVFHGSSHGHGGSKVHGMNTGTSGVNTTGTSSNTQPSSTPPDNAPRPGSTNNDRTNDRTVDRNPGNPNNPSMNPDSRSVQPSTGAGMNDSYAWKNTMSGCQVVIDIISPDEHRVTMYATEGPVVSSPTTPGTPGRLDSTPPDNASGINRNEPASNDPKIAMTAGKVVYRAVFRRATGDEIARTREATRLTDATTSDNR